MTDVVSPAAQSVLDRISASADEDLFSESEVVAALRDFDATTKRGRGRPKLDRSGEPEPITSLAQVARGFAGDIAPLEGLVSADDWEAMLAGLNDRAAVVTQGSKVSIVISDLEGHLRFLSVADAKLLFAPYEFITYEDALKDGKEIKKSKLRPAFPLWLKDPRRRAYDGVTCDPRMRTPSHILNTWKGYAETPKEGECGRMKDHILRAFCSSNEALFETTMQWHAHMLQRPWEKPSFAIVPRGARGLGKSLLGVWVRRMIGPTHSIKLAQASHAVGKFNSQLDAKLHVSLEEATFGGRHSDEGVLKDLVSESTITIEGKFMSPVEQPSFSRWYLPTNERHAVRAGDGERRWLFLDVVDLHPDLDKRNPIRVAHYNDLVEEADNGGVAALMYEWLHYDISDFDRHRPPVTTGLVDQIAQSMSAEETWVFNALEDGVLATHDSESFLDEWPLDSEVTISSAALQASYGANVRSYGGASAGSAAFVRALREHGAISKVRLPAAAKGASRPWGYRFGPRREWQERFSMRFGVEFTDDEGALPPKPGNA